MLFSLPLLLCAALLAFAYPEPAKLTHDVEVSVPVRPPLPRAPLTHNHFHRS